MLRRPLTNEYVRSIFEYGSVCYLHWPNSTLDVMQNIQNRAIRICLKLLPRYVSLKLLHESSCLPTIRERLVQLGVSMLTRMRKSNPHIACCVASLILGKQVGSIRGMSGMLISYGLTSPICDPVPPGNIVWLSTDISRGRYFPFSLLPWQKTSVTRFHEAYIG